LAEIADILSQQSEIAVDLEMDSLHHYREKVCLVQVSTRRQSWLLDPLALPSLAPLAAPLAAPETVVVMHGSDYDIRSLHRDFGIEVTNLFDTMIAARFLGLSEFGLAALLKARFGIELDKKYQKADWSKRPISREMCAYAVADTSDLLPLYDQFREELVRKGRLEWLEEEGRIVCQARVSEKDGPLFQYCKGASKLRGHGLAIIEELLQMRDRQSELLDRPPFKVLSADTLIEVAETRPRSLHDLSLVKGMTSGQLQRHGAGILSAVERGIATPEDSLPNRSGCDVTASGKPLSGRVYPDRDCGGDGYYRYGDAAGGSTAPLVRPGKSEDIRPHPRLDPPLFAGESGDFPQRILPVLGAWNGSRQDP